MPDTGEKGENVARVNAKEKETTRELEKLVSRTRAAQTKEHSSKRPVKPKK
jgi:hypothetical protein